jgi:hypothetical protein
MDGQMLFEMLGGEQHREICMHPSLCAICSLGPAGAGPDVALEADAGGAQLTAVSDGNIHALK